MEDFFKLSILIVTRANKKDSLGGLSFLEKVFHLRNKNNPEVEISFVPGMEECVIRTERLMGGRIGVEFEQGEGSTFWFTIPQKPIIHFAERREIVRAMENY